MAGRELVEGHETVLVLGGGNALGAYHLGVIEALLSRAEPDRVLGASIGAATGAVLLGNPPEARLPRLREFWRAVSRPDGPWAAWLPGPLRARWSNGLGLAALLGGQWGLTRLRVPGPLSILPFLPPDVALQDHGPLAALLDRLVDWDRLNASPVPLSLVATDLERGEEVWWSTRDTRIGPQHILAATALPPLLPPVPLEGRLFWDGGLVNNLPVDRAVAEGEGRPMLVVASDLYAPEGAAPGSLDGAALRAQDLGFALQARTRLRALERERGLLARAEPGTPPVTVAHLVLRPPAHQRALKALDFSGTSLAERSAQGRADAEALLARLPSADLARPFSLVTLPVA